jgi:hypothetical protein
MAYLSFVCPVRLTVVEQLPNPRTVAGLTASSPSLSARLR